MKNPPSYIVQLVHIKGPLEGQIQEFAQNVITIGRYPHFNVTYPKDLVIISRDHAEIQREGNRFKVINKSNNNTYVNVKRLEKGQEAYLKNGDVLMFAEGGPKASFLSKIAENQEEIDRLVAASKPIEPQIQPKEPIVEHPPEEVYQEQKRVVEEISIQRVQAPLIVQYGPTLRSFKELPVTIGKKSDCNFVLSHSALSDQHAVIFFSNDQYWVKDLTGKRAVSINNQPIELQAPLLPNDILALSPQGPRFRFLGEGRLAEYEEPAQEASPPVNQVTPEKPQENEENQKKSKGLGAFYKDIFRK